MTPTPSLGTSVLPSPVPAHGVTIAIVPCQHDHARLIAAGRTQANNRTRKPEQDLGKAGNDKSDAYGALAEIVLIEELERFGQRPTYTLLSARPVGKPDMQWVNLQWEIKSSLPGKPALNVNITAHKKKVCDFYIPCLFDSPTVMHIMRPIPYAEVSTWPQVLTGRSPYFTIPRSQLQPLASLQELLELADFHTLFH